MDYFAAISLHNFLSGIRDCKTKDDERIRVNMELANIRSIFATAANLTSYDKKKYVWKLCFISMLGYEVDFGHVEFISLLSSTKFREKFFGYMAISLIFRPGDEFLMLAVNSIRNDIVGPFNAAQTLALAAVSNIGGNDLAEALSGDVQRLIVSPLEAVPSYSLGQNVENEFRNKSQLCKKASICLLRLFQTNPECVILDEWVMRLAKLLEDRDMGVVTSILSLLLAFASYSPPIFEPLVPYVISVLTRLVVNRTCPADYLYYHNPSPWIQVKCLSFLQFYKIPEDRTQVDLLQDIMSKILIKTEVSESNNKSNAELSVLFEAINLVIIYGSECPAQLRDRTADLLGKFISSKDANIRYLGIEAMTRFVNLEGPQVAERYQTDVLDCLKDPDISLIKRALNLLSVMTYEKNARDIVGELVVSLPRLDIVIKEDIVVKIAIFAEKYSNNSQWYLDTMIQVILLAGDYVAEDVWYRIVQVVINNNDIHEYAAEKLLTSVQSKSAHEIVVAVAANLLGEIGVTICEKPGMTGYDQFVALHQHFANASLKTQNLMLTTYVKLLTLYPDQIRDLVIEVLHNNNKNNNGNHSNQIRPFLRITSSEADIGDMSHQPPLSSEFNNNENSNSDNSESKDDSVILPTRMQPSYPQTTAINPMITSSNTANVAQANHGNTPQPPPQNTRPHNWSTSLFDCLQEEESCWWSFWCCCVVAARNAGEVGLGEPKMHIFLFVAALIVGWLLIVLSVGLAGPLFLIGVAAYYVYYRTNIRRQIKRQLHILVGEWTSDCLLHFCCACCAIAQEARESLNAPRNKRLDYCSAQDLAEMAPAADNLFDDVEQGPVANNVDGWHSLHYKLSVTSQNLVIVLGVLSLGLLLLANPLIGVILLLIFLHPAIVLYLIYWRSRRKFAQLDYVVKMFCVGFFISTIQSILLEEILQNLVTLLGLLLFFLTSSYTLSSPPSDATSSSSSSAAFSAMLGQLYPTRGSFLYESDPSHVSLFAAYTSSSHPLSPRINLSSSDFTSFNPDEIPRDLLAHNLWLVLFVLFLMTFVVTAGIEESMKHFAVRCCRFAAPLKDPHVVLVYLVAAALGFATAENIGYVFGVHRSPIPGTSRFVSEQVVLFMRLLVPIHLICAILQAAQMAQVVLGIAPQLNLATQLARVLLPAIFLHGSFEYSLYAIGVIQYAFDLQWIALDIFSVVIPLVIVGVGAIWAVRSYTEVEQRFQQNWRTIPTQEDEGVENTLL